MNLEGKPLEEAFDSEEELVAFVRRMERESNDGVSRTISVIDPDGKEKFLARAQANGRSPA